MLLKASSPEYCLVKRTFLPLYGLLDMNRIDESFKEEFKPLQIPVEYNTENSWEEKSIYALALLEEGTARDVAAKIEELEPSSQKEEAEKHTSEVLKALFDKGLLKGRERNNQTIYNLSKIETPNSGKVDPDLL